MDRGRLSILACEAGKIFAGRVIARLHELLREEERERGRSEADIEEMVASLAVRGSNEVWFANKEVKTEIRENIRGDDVYIIQNIFEPRGRRSINDNLMALLTAINAARQSDADAINVVVPLFPYSRQERKKAREGVTASQVAQFLEVSGATRIITMDIHAEAVVGFFREAKFENLRASGVIVDFLRKSHSLENLVVVSPDAGGAGRVRHFAKLFSTEFALIDKVRDYGRPNMITQMRLVGRVKGRNVLVVDDMIDTGGSIVRAVKTLKKEGAKDISVCCAHPLFSGSAVRRLSKAHKKGLIKDVLGTDSVMWGAPLSLHPWYHEVSVAHLFARVIHHINHKRSVSELLE